MTGGVSVDAMTQRADHGEFFKVQRPEVNFGTTGYARLNNHAPTRRVPQRLFNRLRSADSFVRVVQPAHELGARAPTDHSASGDSGEFGHGGSVVAFGDDVVGTELSGQCSLMGVSSQHNHGAGWAECVQSGHRSEPNDASTDHEHWFTVVGWPAQDAMNRDR